MSRYCGSCGRPIKEHPSNKILGDRIRFCPIKPARTRKGKPQRYVYDRTQAAEERKASTGSRA